jgi:hypothetical protein
MTAVYKMSQEYVDALNRVIGAEEGSAEWADARKALEAARMNSHVTRPAGR